MSENIKDIYPLSPMQQGMLFHTLYAPETEVYTEQLACKFVGNLNVAAFKKAWQQVVDRHDALRSAFVWEDLEEPLQVVYEHVEIPFETPDWSDKSPEEQTKAIDALIDAERKQGFELTEAPLMRIQLIKLNENEHYFIWSHHHLLFDGWGFAIVLRELFQLYEAFSSGKTLNLPPVRPFRDYIAWLKEQDMAKAENFWRNQLSDFYAPTPFHVDRKNAQPGSVYPKTRRPYSKALSERIEQFGKQFQVTVNTIFQGALALVLSKYSGQNDVLFGSTVSGRPTELAGVEQMVGLFINTLPIRVQIDDHTRIKDWLQNLQMQNVHMRQFEYTPLIDIQGWSDVPRSLPLFESLLVFENYPVSETLSQSSGSLQIQDLRSVEKTNYPLTIVTAPGKTLTLEIAYDANRFEAETIERLHDHFEQALQQLVSDPERQLKDIEIIGPKERQNLLKEWNGQQKPFPQDKTIHQLFEEQAERTPNEIAVDYNDQTLTFAELNRQANQLAHYLRTKGVKPETFVGISLPRSIETVVAALAVLKAGGAYLPIDPEYPEDRIHYMVEDSGIPILITKDEMVQRFERHALTIISLPKDNRDIATQPENNPENTTQPENVAFIIYTSGSTGQPKGVLLHHRGAANFFQNMGNDFELKTGKSMLQLASFSFDAATSEIFSALLNGAKVQMIDKETLLSTESLIEFINKKKVTTGTIPPSLLTLIPEDRLNMETVISVGDACSWELAKRFKDKTRFVNGYGPTEGTIGAIWGQVNEILQNTTTTVPIGRPNANVKIYILDSNLHLTPIGAPGEIYIGGAGVSRGYLNRPDLTAEKFIPDPFNEIPGSRMYKTGDLARWLPDGQIEFIGRVDFQVKIRGFRIELGEIEAEILKHPKVKDAVVAAKGQTAGEKKLVAYFILEDGQEVTPEEIRNFIKDHLPEYMVPSAFVQMEKFPLTPNGKVNRRALPDPEAKDMVAERFVPPRTPEEELLANIWQDILDLDQVGIDNNFFDLGGHSLLATQLASRVRDAFDVELPLKDIFSAPTIRQLAERIKTLSTQEGSPQAPPIRKTERSGPLPLSFAQQRLWFLDQLQPGSPFYNIPGAVRLIGELNVEALEKSLSEVVRRHETLRTTFNDENGKPFAVIHEAQPVRLPVTDLSALPEDERQEKLKSITLQENRKPFDLKTGPLFRGQLIKLNEDEHVVLFTMHHIISDGWSMGIFMQEIAQSYAAFARGQEPQLPELEIQYVDYASWQQEWLQGEVLEKELDFWRQTIGMDPPVLNLPFDRPRPAVQTFNGKTISMPLAPELSARIKKLSQEQGVTPFMTLLAAFQTLLHRYSGQDEILVGSPIANRNRSETERLIGFFVNNIVLKSDFYDNPEFGELLRRVREATLNAYAHQDVPFEQIVDTLITKREMSHSPLFQVMFVMQNLPEGKFELPGLTMRSAEAEIGTAKFDLSLVVTEGPDRFNFSFEFNTDLFDESTIVRMQRHLTNLLTEITQDPDRPVDLINYLSDEELQTLLNSWNQTDTPFPIERTVHDWFADIAQAQPEAPAVIFQANAQAAQQMLTYRQLDQQANRLAHALIEAGVTTEDIVGISMHRSPEMVVSMLAILKAGAAYVPIDPNYPEERIRYMIEDSGLKLVVTQTDLVPALQTYGVKLIAADDAQALASQPDSKPNIRVLPDNLAYVIYTSGSTGKPKGTLLHHRGACNLAHIQKQAFKVGPGSKILQFASLSFDAATWEFLMALLSGSALVLTDAQTIGDGQALADLLEAQHITTITIPPSVLAVLPKKELPSLKTIITAGEAVSAELVEQWRPNRRFFNAYGPTETTVCATMHECVNAYAAGPPIGKPNPNFRTYVLDARLQPQPVGIPGELCVAGVGLARGYWNRPDLTAEKFIPNPFGKQPGERLYRTGDLVRWLPDGNLQFLGRIDQQVKVRGFRIELGEIEAALREFNSVKDVVVLAREDVPGDKRLVAYLVCDDPKPTIQELREGLGKKLPEYMVPSAFVFLDAMPLTPNGKINRRALPRPEFDRTGSQAEYVAPRDESEEKLCAIVGELLNLEKVGIHDNFFELGGHSLLATQFMSRLRSDFQVELPLITLFEKPTVAQLAEEIAKTKLQPQKTAAPQIKKVARERRRVKRSDLGNRN